MSTDHIKMLCDIGELAALLGEGTLDDFLDRTVEMVASHMRADVCSIYLYDESKDELVLKATKGLSDGSVGRIVLKTGEGLVGTALSEQRPVIEKVGSANPKFKPYPGSNEERYEAFLAIPILRGASRVGVLVVQRGKDHPFADRDILAMRATASQLASMLENIKLLMATGISPAPEKKDFDLSGFRFLKGKSASGGSAHAKVSVLGGEKEHEKVARGATAQYTIDDFERALAETQKQLEELQQRVEEKLSDAASLIFASHLLMLKDNGFIGGMRELIAGGENPPVAVLRIFTKYRDIFLKSPSQIIREKVQDIEDLTERIIANLAPVRADSESHSGRIIISRDLFPSGLLKLSAEGIAGVVLVSGGVTSHVSILARSLELPLVFIDEPRLLGLPQGTEALLDADVGNLYVNPSAEVIARFRERDRAGEELGIDHELLARPTATADGIPVTLTININLLSDVLRSRNVHIDGVGLYRTEFPFMIRNTFPTEEEQYVIYKKLIDDMKGKPVTFRTLDIGGDKVLSYYEGAKEENPFLGMRSIRFSLRHPDIFRQQIRAILRAGCESRVKIMFPMISSLDELARSKSVVLECMEELRREGYPCASRPEIGIMVEIPSVLPLIRELAAESDFFSIGTNDLIQYTLAVDRTNEKVADMYIPHHPALLRSLATIAEAAADGGIEASVCGDMAVDTRYIPFLLGIGIRSFSVDPLFLPRVKKAIMATSARDAAAIAGKMLTTARISDIEEILKATSHEE